MKFTRRSLLTVASVAALPTSSWAQGLSRGFFTHGVASGDPLQDRVVIWTRFVPASGNRVGWEVSEDETFARIARSGSAQARFENDFCVKVDVTGLQPGRRYFYRFLSGSDPSPTGQTRTAPASGADRMGIGLFSCSNFPFGYFHAYGHAARREDIDLVIHVGDYIYETQRGAYPSAAEAAPGRDIDPVTEIVSLSDYYQRYATYHTDHDLLELRRLKPMCATWDDHELANNTWRNGAQAHDPATEGSFTARMAAAAKAYFDWLPIRRPEANSPRLYRNFDWGDLATIVMLDTRYIGRDEQLDYRTLGANLADPNVDARALAAQFRPQLNAPGRQMLGAAQERWLNETLASSKRAGRTWQVLAQQVQIGPQNAPSDVSRFIGPNVSAGSRAWFEGAARLAPEGLPWNLDTWHGYPAARDRFLEACATHANNALVLGGDSHNCWVNNLMHNGRRAGLEFAGGSVSSPGFERTMNAVPFAESEAALRAANPDMAYCDVAQRGYGAFTLTREGCASEWIGTGDVRSPVAATPIVTRIEAAAGANAGPGPWTVAG